MFHTIYRRKRICWCSLITLINSKQSNLTATSISVIVAPHEFSTFVLVHLSKKIANLFAAVKIMQISFKTYVTKTTLFFGSIGRALVRVYKPKCIKMVSEAGPDERKLPKIWRFKVSFGSKNIQRLRWYSNNCVSKVELHIIEDVPMIHWALRWYFCLVSSCHQSTRFPEHLNHTVTTK